MTTTALALRPDNVDRYLAEVSRYPLLNRDQELKLALRLWEHGEVSAAHELVVSNLRFVVKVAKEYSGYGLKFLDLIQEGNVGLMIAVKKFDPSKGYRLISYAVWWIRAHIQDFILRSWSLVKLGTTRAQRKLFFKLRSTRTKLQKAARRAGQAAPDTAALAEALDVPESEISNMESRLAARDFSLNLPLTDESSTTHLERLPDADEGQDDFVAKKEERLLLEDALEDVTDDLDERERHILENRMLTDEPETLQDIGQRFGLTRERARQIERKLLGKLRKALTERQVSPLLTQGVTVSP